MLGTLKTIFRNPFVLAFGGVTLAVVGVVLGLMIQNNANEEARKIALEAKRAAEAAEYLRLNPPKPALQFRVTPPPSEDPLTPRYVQLGDELVANFGRSARFILVEVNLGTRYGEDAEQLITLHKLALRAQTLAILSKMTFKDAQRPDAKVTIQNNLRVGLNSFLQEIDKFSPIDEVLITRMVVK